MALDIRFDNDKSELRIRVSGRFDFALHQDFRQATDQASDADRHGERSEGG